MKKYTYLLVSIIAVLFIRCEYFNSHPISKQEIKKQSQWNSKDIYPTSTECIDLPKKEQFPCFQSIISTTILEYFFAKNLTIDKDFDEQMSVTLLIDEEGVLSIINITENSNITEILPYVNTFIEQAIAKLPDVLPAVKSNTGQKVKSKVTIPIRVVSFEQ